MDFDLSYQAELIRKMADRKFLPLVHHLLDPNYFDPQYEDVVSEILRRYRSTRKVLTRNQLKQICNRNNVKLDGKQTAGDASFDLDEVKLFCGDRVIREGIAKVQVYRAQGKHEKCFQVMRDHERKMPHTILTEAVDILKQTGSMPLRKGLIPLGLPEIDTWLGGGVGTGDLAAVLAPTSGGKTTFLIYVAATAARAGRIVYYVTLEVPHTEIEAKLRRCLTGKVHPTRADWKRESRKIKGQLFVQEHPPRTVTVLDIENEMPAGINLLLVDYADYLSPTGGSVGLEHQDLGNIYASLKRVGMENHLAVWTASQVNRPAYNDRGIYVQDVEASLKKMFVADQVLGLSQDTKEKADEETGNSRITIGIAKNRHGARFESTRITVNWATGRFIQKEWA